MSVDELTARYEITEAIALAARLLTVAAQINKTVDKDVALPITKAIEADQHDNLNPEIEADFWTAFTKLCQLIQPVSVISFSHEYVISTKRYRKYYAFWSIVILCLIIPFSVLGFISSAINADITETAKSICDTVTVFQCAKPPLSDQPIIKATVSNNTQEIPARGLHLFRQLGRVGDHRARHLDVILPRNLAIALRDKSRGFPGSIVLPGASGSVARHCGSGTGICHANHRANASGLVSRLMASSSLVIVPLLTLITIRRTSCRR